MCESDVAARWVQPSFGATVSAFCLISRVLEAYFVGHLGWLGACFLSESDF
jgi:hypothetical protein